MTDQAYVIPADARSRFREAVRGVFDGQIDEQIQLAWQTFERVLTTFPAEEPEPAEVTRSDLAAAVRDAILAVPVEEIKAGSLGQTRIAIALQSRYRITPKEK